VNILQQEEGKHYSASLPMSNWTGKGKTHAVFHSRNHDSQQARCGQQVVPDTRTTWDQVHFDRCLRCEKIIAKDVASWQPNPIDAIHSVLVRAHVERQVSAQDVWQYLHEQGYEVSNIVKEKL
jgi:hypothetical protein